MDDYDPVSLTQRECTNPNPKQVQNKKQSSSVLPLCHVEVTESQTTLSAATCPSSSSSSLSVTRSLHLRSMEPSGQESSEKGTHHKSVFHPVSAKRTRQHKTYFQLEVMLVTITSEITAVVSGQQCGKAASGYQYHMKFSLMSLFYWFIS